MGGGYTTLNAVGSNSGVSPDDVQFEAIYNEHVQFLLIKGGGTRPSYPRSGGNQGWNGGYDDGWRDRYRDLHD
ncbi:hypothetical protein MTR67_002678 [Solanum verrucosum]|uniref:Uncharacterized protein n=1 Tax=Solanum verrucosum TaxID=315347 RepID=A0AAF0T9M7_SOLVR|nr:hypothetical protein MTR67_002678 [Solanum verrucosum]